MITINISPFWGKSFTFEEDHIHKGLGVHGNKKLSSHVKNGGKFIKCIKFPKALYAYKRDTGKHWQNSVDPDQTPQNASTPFAFSTGISINHSNNKNPSTDSTGRSIVSECRLGKQS